MAVKVGVNRAVYLALNEWYKNGFTEEKLVAGVVNNCENGFGFKSPYRAFNDMRIMEAIKLAAVGRMGYELTLTTDELIRGRFDSSTEGEKELIVWLLDLIGEDVEGVNY